MLGATHVSESVFYYNGAYATGGLWTFGAVTIERSLFAHNGGTFVAGMRCEDGGGAPVAVITDSTFAYNRSHDRIGGISMLIPATISNSTIAKNEAFGGPRRPLLQRRVARSRKHDHRDEHLGRNRRRRPSSMARHRSRARTIS